MKETVPDSQRVNVSLEHYRCFDIERFPVGNNSELVYSRVTRSARILPSNVAQLLSCCRTFGTLDSHAQGCCRELKLGQEHIGFVRNQLSEFVAAGLLVSHTDLLNRCKYSVNTQNVSKEITSIGWATHNRVETLKRSMVSYIENGKQFGRVSDFIVMDDSESADTRNEYRQMLQLLKARYDVNISYAGLEEKVRFANTLIDKGLHPDIVNFALFDVEQCGHSLGANRNALLLHTIGDIIFSIDDDTVCRIAASPEFNDGLAFISGINPMETWLFANRETALRSVTFVEKDILAIHEQLLGKDLFSCFSTFSVTAKVDLNQMGFRFFRSLESGAGRVLLTLNGLIGDSGWGLPHFYLFFSGNSHKRFTQSESHYRSVCASREMLQVVSRTSISSEPTFFMTYSVGIDNRALLPPFMPVKRAQDRVFAFTLWKCFEDSYLGYLPWVLFHEPPGRQANSSTGIWRSASVRRINDLIAGLVLSFAFVPGTSDERERMRTLGRYFTELGSMSLPDFEEFIRLYLWREANLTISSMEQRLQACNESPDFWANDVKKYLDTLRDNLLKPVAPHDLIDGRGVGEALELTQRLVLKFGQLLYWWPDIVEVARDLRAQGQRLADLI